MGVPTIDTGPMALDDLETFAEGRLDGERWELIEGAFALSPSGTGLHQLVIGNFLVELSLFERRVGALWRATSGVNVVVSPFNAPIPDLMVRPKDLLRDWKCDDVIVTIEVLSPSTRTIDLTWKTKAYTSLPSLQHYVVAAQDVPEIVCFDRASGFAERRLQGLDATLDLSAIDVSLPLADIYRDCGF